MAKTLYTTTPAPLKKRLLALAIDLGIFLTLLFVTMLLTKGIMENIPSIKSAIERIAQLKLQYGISDNWLDNLGLEMEVMQSYNDAVLPYLEKYQTAQFYHFVIIAFIYSFIFYLILPFKFGGGRTIGKKICNLKVVNFMSGREPHVFSIFSRWLAGIFMIELCVSRLLYYIPAIVSLILVAFHKEHRAIHDFIAKTVVVEEIN